MFEDGRSRRVVFLSHCILNSNTRAQGLVTPESLERSSRFLKALLDKGIGVVQMPCPELFFGLIRAPATKKEYGTQGFRDHCDKIAREVVRDISLYLSEGVDVLAVVGVEGSPSCGVQFTHAEPGKPASKGRGMFMESIEREFSESGVRVRLVGFPAKSSYGVLEDAVLEVLRSD
jgi:predicted secreted protein